MKLLLLALLLVLLFTGCQAAYTFKDGRQITGSFNPTPKDVVALEGAIR